LCRYKSRRAIYPRAEISDAWPEAPDLCDAMVCPGRAYTQFEACRLRWWRRVSESLLARTEPRLRKFLPASLTGERPDWGAFGCLR
jgi:hypothetical protein